MKDFFDNELGKITIKPNIRAKNIIARRTLEGFQLTVPYGFSIINIYNFLKNHKSKLMDLKIPKSNIIEEDMELNTFSFKVIFSRTNLISQTEINLKNGVLNIIMPTDFDIISNQNQIFLKEIIKKVMRIEAKRLLIPLTKKMAHEHNLHIANVKIGSSKTRWGSCSGRKNINLSIFLMLLPANFIEYVILHELAHTIHMNHGKQFWALLSQLCQDNAKMISQNLACFKSKELELLK